MCFSFLLWYTNVCISFHFIEIFRQIIFQQLINNEGIQKRILNEEQKWGNSEITLFNKNYVKSTLQFISHNVNWFHGIFLKWKGRVLFFCAKISWNQSCHKNATKPSVRKNEKFRQINSLVVFSKCVAFTKFLPK